MKNELLFILSENAEQENQSYMSMRFRQESIKIKKRNMRERKMFMGNLSMKFEREKLYDEIWDI